MNRIVIAQLENSRLAFSNAAKLIHYMEKYSFSLSVNANKHLDYYAKTSAGLPLPSGKWGNAIALALEFNNYEVAEYLIENAERFNLDTKSVASDFGGKNRCSLKDMYLFSRLSYDDKLLPNIVGLSKKDYKKYVEFFSRNREANKRLEDKLVVSEEDKSTLLRIRKLKK